MILERLRYHIGIYGNRTLNPIHLKVYISINLLMLLKYFCLTLAHQLIVTIHRMKLQT